ncbi:GNAT family N-acetyltransferase [Streptomyces sp. NPDC057101]|uniref:GNAT family N-acetyltransferase n=1 Tax=Streptomyces sp. NPDC057101 TaxID=3346020 RepID=UPI003638E3BB
MRNPPVLTGRLLRLEPLHPDHAAGLLAAAGERRPPFARVPRTLAEAGRHVRDARAACLADTGLTFAVLDRSTRRVLGSTGFTELSWWGREGRRPSGPDAAEIGTFWIGPPDGAPAHGAEAVTLMLRHAFDGWNACRVSFSVDSEDEPFAAAVEKAGARADGVRRAHCCGPDGTLRSRLLYSVLDTEWPAVARHAARRPVAPVARAV